MFMPSKLTSQPAFSTILRSAVSDINIGLVVLMCINTFRLMDSFSNAANVPSVPETLYVPFVYPFLSQLFRESFRRQRKGCHQRIRDLILYTVG